jgi:hypothetical protein
MWLHWLTECQIGYVAGMIDGEGTILIYKKNNKHRFSYSSQCYITNTNLKMLEYIQRILIMGAIRIRYYEGENRKICYILDFDKSEMEYLLPKIVNALVIKKQQAILVMEFLELSNLPRGKNKPSERQMNDYLRKKELYEEVLELNK